MNYGQVTFAASLATVDSADAGPEPDIIPVSGYVDFVPSRVVTYSDELGRVIVLAPVTAGLDADGVMRDPEGNPSVALIAADDPSLSHQGWTWEGYLRLNGVDPVGPYPFVLHTGETVNLGLQAPLEISNGIAILRGPRGEKGDKGDFGSGAVESVNGKTGVVNLDLGDFTGTSDLVHIGGDIQGTPTNPTIPNRLFPINNLNGANPNRPNTTATAVWIADNGNRPAANGTSAGGAYAAAEGDIGLFRA